MKKTSKQSRLPKGWTLAKVEALRKHYDNQTDEEAAAEIEAAYRNQKYSTVSVPTKLLPQIRKLIAAAEKR